MAKSAGMVPNPLHHVFAAWILLNAKSFAPFVMLDSAPLHMQESIIT
jgi:hypothetical protein